MKNLADKLVSIINKNNVLWKKIEIQMKQNYKKMLKLIKNKK